MGQFKKRVILSETWRSHVKSKNPFSFYGNADPSTSLGMTGAPVFFLGFGQQKAPAEAGAFVGYFAEHSIIQRFAAAGAKFVNPTALSWPTATMGATQLVVEKNVHSHSNASHHKYCDDMYSKDSNHK